MDLWIYGSWYFARLPMAIAAGEGGGGGFLEDEMEKLKN